MMPRTVVSLLVILLAASPTMVLAASPAPAAKPASAAKYNLKFLNIFPVASPSAKAEQHPFVNRVRELSGGRINIKMYSPGELAQPKEFPEMVRDRVADMAYIYMPYHSDIFPIFEAFSLPFMFKTYEQAFRLTRDIFGSTPQLTAPLKSYKLHPLWFTDGASQIIQTKKPIRAVADIKGLKLRTAGGMANIIVSSMGATPVALMVGDAYLSLQSGVVDGTFTAGLFQEMYKWYEVAPNFLVPSSLLMTPLGVIVINTDLWASLSKEDQNILQKAALEQEEIVMKRWTRDYWDVLERMKGKGGAVVMLSDTETQKFAEVTKAAYATYYKNNPGTEALIKRMQDWVAAHPAK